MGDILSDLFGSPNDNKDLMKAESSWKDRCANDLELFCKHYLGDTFTSEFCDFHKDVFGTIQGYLFNKDYANLKKYMVRAAPRGHGKSQIISMGLPLFCICYKYRMNILIVSDTSDQAAQFISDIKLQLEDNDLIISDFGDLTGDKWKADRIVTSNGVHCIGKGASQKLRGIKYNNKRPDLVIIDDLENDENVETDGQRKKLFNWFMKALLKAGYIDTIFIYIGTILSYEALLYKVLHDKQFSMWNRKIYKAVYKFSESPLWDDWENILGQTELSDDEDEQQKIAENAYKFYLDHKQEMLDEVVCLWPEKEPDYYYSLMIEKFMDEESFNSEEQNDPMTEDLRDFKEQWLLENTYDELPEITEVYGAVDPNVVEGKKNDTSAIIMLGRGIDKKIYVLEADIKNRKAEDVIDEMTYYIAKYYDKLKGFVVETNIMQQFFANTVKDKFINMGFYVTWIEVKHLPGDAKSRRIKSMIPKIKLGYVKFNKSHTKLHSQLKNYPKAKDDGPDALQMALAQIMNIELSSFGFSSINTGISNGKKSREPKWYQRLTQRR